MLEEAVLENGLLRLTVLPELGAKLGSLLCLGDGREHLLQPPEHPRRRAAYGAPFEQYDTSGFDECFPTVGACPTRGSSLPDHGELWAVPWTVTEQGQTFLTTEVAGRAFPYLFSRRLSLRESQVQLEYRVRNTGDTAFPYLWSAHPLLRVVPGDRIRLPDEVRSVKVESSAGGRLDGSVEWTDELAVLNDPARGWADKLFAGPLREGWCSLVYSDGALLTFRFSPDEAPYLGLWICQGGWPDQGGRPGHYTVALEPCTAATDRLDRALELEAHRWVEPGQERSWRLCIEVRPARRRS